MKPKKKMHGQEEYELDNYLNEEDDRYYESSSNATIWYSWKLVLWQPIQQAYAHRSTGLFVFYIKIIKW